MIPFYVAGLFSKIAAEGKLLPTIKMFVKLYVMILIFQWLYIAFQFLISTLFTKENKFKNLKGIAPAYFTALGTQSSASTIPVNLESSKDSGVSEDIADFVIPLCATIHLSGDTICLVIGSMGIMLANGLTPTLSMFLPFIFMLGITMVAAPGSSRRRSHGGSGPHQIYASFYRSDEPADHFSSLFPGQLWDGLQYNGRSGNRLYGRQHRQKKRRKGIGDGKKRGTFYQQGFEKTNHSADHRTASDGDRGSCRFHYDLQCGRGSSLRGISGGQHHDSSHQHVFGTGHRGSRGGRPVYWDRKSM